LEIIRIKNWRNKLWILWNKLIII